MQNYVCPYGRIIQVHLNYVKWLNKDLFDLYHSETPKTALHVPIWQSHIFSKKSTVGKKCVSRKTTPVLGLILIHNWLKENTSDITKKKTMPIKKSLPPKARTWHCTSATDHADPRFGKKWVWNDLSPKKPQVLPRRFSLEIPGGPPRSHENSIFSPGIPT